jgi:peroxiredoxin Q/BCP
LRKFSEKENLPFILLSDTDFKVCNAYEVYKEKSMYGRKYMGIERSTFLIDKNGIVQKA